MAYRVRYRPHQRVKSREGSSAGQVPAEVECRASGSGHRQPCNEGGFVVLQPLIASDHTVWWMGVAPDQLHRDVVIDPLRAMERRGRQTRNRRSLFGPEPRAHGSVAQRNRPALGDINVLVDRTEVGPQLMAGQLTAAHRLTADDHVPHTDTVTLPPAKSLKLKRLSYFAARRRDWFSVGAGVGQAMARRPDSARPSVSSSA